MIILRQREFGRTGLSKDQAKEWFKNGRGIQNKAAKRALEISQGDIKWKRPGHKTIEDSFLASGRMNNAIKSSKNATLTDIKINQRDYWQKEAEKELRKRGIRLDRSTI